MHWRWMKTGRPSPLGGLDQGRTPNGSRSKKRGLRGVILTSGAGTWSRGRPSVRSCGSLNALGAGDSCFRTIASHDPIPVPALPHCILAGAACGVSCHRKRGSFWSRTAFTNRCLNACVQRTTAHLLASGPRLFFKRQPCGAEPAARCEQSPGVQGAPEQNASAAWLSGPAMRVGRAV